MDLKISRLVSWIVALKGAKEDFTVTSRDK